MNHLPSESYNSKLCQNLNLDFENEKCTLSTVLDLGLLGKAHKTKIILKTLELPEGVIDTDSLNEYV